MKKLSTFVFTFTPKNWDKYSNEKHEENIIFIYIGAYVAHIEQPCIYSFALGMSIKIPSLGSKIQQVCTATFVML